MSYSQKPTLDWHKRNVVYGSGRYISPKIQMTRFYIQKGLVKSKLKFVDRLCGSHRGGMTTPKFYEPHM